MQPLTSFFSLSLLLVVMAAALDVLANLLLAKSGGFRRRWLGFFSLVLVGLAWRMPCGAVSVFWARRWVAGCFSARSCAPALLRAWLCS